MNLTPFTLLAPLLLVQGDASPTSNGPLELSQLPVTQSAAPRCAIAMALMGERQRQGDERARAWPDLQGAGAREFFVQSMAKLMDDRGLDRPALLDLLGRETQRLKGEGDDQIAAMMPACLMMKQAAGL
jgi:hypothetical protein